MQKKKACTSIDLARRHIQAVDLMLAAAFCGWYAHAAQPKHIVLMMTDDLGFNSPGYRNPDLHTPTLDKLAAAGVKLDNFYAYKYCAPTRGSVLTGRMPYRLNAVQKNLIPVLHAIDMQCLSVVACDLEFDSGNAH